MKQKRIVILCEQMEKKSNIKEKPAKTWELRFFGLPNQKYPYFFFVAGTHYENTHNMQFMVCLYLYIYREVYIYIEGYKQNKIPKNIVLNVMSQNCKKNTYTKQTLLDGKFTSIGKEIN